ncbi:hypothetical protein AZH51_10965 [Branchiibius sp. NY16-3462-2]|nr:hypothetical protein AZH51_10965 [Branchiibius sp. NY16-3462-2]
MAASETEVTTVATQPAESGADLTRSRLIDAARKAFGEKGFHATTTRDIASAAGLSPAAVYVHHRTKEDLLYAISRAGHEEILADMRAAIAGAADTPGKLEAVIYAMVLRHTREYATARVVNYELDGLSAQHREDIEKLRAQIQGIVRRLLRAGTAEGSFTVDDVRITSNAIVAMAIDAARWYRPATDPAPERIASHHARMALRMVSAAE